jgi:hypothetical protein
LSPGISDDNRTFLGYAGSHHIIAYRNDTTGAIQYAHHTAIDELDLKNLPGNRGPAAKSLAGIVDDARNDLQLRQEISELTPTLSPWLTDSMVAHHVPYDVTCDVLGVVRDEDHCFNCLKLVSLTPGSPAERHLADKNVIGFYIISMNGIRIRTVSDIQLILHNYHQLSTTNADQHISLVSLYYLGCLTSLNLNQVN